MTPIIATIIFAIMIFMLFALDRDRSVQTSKALWIPVIWLTISTSRPISQWLQMAPALDSPDQYLDGSPLDRLILTILLAAGLAVIASRARRVGSLLLANWPIVLFFYYCALSVFWSEFPFVAFKRWTRGVGDFVMLLIVLTEHEPQQSIKRLLSRVSFFVIPLSVLLIEYYPAIGVGIRRWVDIPTYIGVTTNKNLLGMVCLVCGTASAWRFAAACGRRESGERTRHLVAHGAILAMVCWLLWMANSITPTGCLLLTVGLIAVLNVRTIASKAIARHAVVLALVLVPFIVLFLGSDARILHLMGREPTLTGRTMIWDQLLRVSGNSLIGTGFESFWLGPRVKHLWATFAEINEAHNGYLEVFLNLGWIGISLLGLIILTGYRNILALANEDEAKLKLAYLVAAVVYGFTEAGFRMMHPVWILLLYAVTVVPTRAKETRKAGRPQVRQFASIAHLERVQE